MEKSDNSYLGYNTHILGTTKNIIDCLGIVLYNKEELLPEDDVEKISIYNIDKVIQSLEECKKYTTISRVNSEDPFKYIYNNGSISGFNVIIYLRNSDRAGIGYTEFLNIQGKERNINITLNFNTSISSNLNIDILNSLTVARLSNICEIPGDELQNYTSVEKIKKDKLCSPVLFTTHLTSIGTPKYESNIWMSGEGIVDSQGNMCGLEIFKNQDADPYNNKFTNHQVGVYLDNNICYYSWEGLKYSINSLSLSNRFGSPISYTQNTNGYKEIIGGREGQDVIKRFSGRYAIVEDSSGKIIIYDTVSERFINFKTSGKLFIDETSPKIGIIELPQILSPSNVIQTLPDITNTFYNIQDLRTVTPVLKIGDWYVISQGNSYIFSNLRQSVAIHKSEFSKVLILSDLYLGLFSEEKDYLTIYTGLGENWKSERWKKYESGGELTIDSELGILIAEEEKEKYIKSYKENKLRIIKSGEPIGNTWLKVFRRNYYPSDGWPEISSVISSLRGLIFYIKEGKLNYL